MRIASWRRVRDVFDRVAEGAPSERAALLDDLAEGDDELKHEVLALLGALDEDDDRFERGGAALAHSAIAAAEETTLTGLEIAPYRLVRRVGRGGMGDVYLAERCDGEATRHVAIKLIKPGMDTESVIRRFRQERQILAGLGHPSIAALLDGGVTAEGRPYLVMEHVEGEPITTYCDRRQLLLEDRVRLVQDVCAAVHFAHQNLVIHRDLKPANILVTADGAVKLLDFGVAKLLRPQGMATATQTMFGGRAFTPSYASPEQVRGEAVTTASDTYSLGVILYELLTGRLPFDVETGSLADVLQAVSTAEPTRPSEAIPDEITQPQPVRAIRRALRRRLAGDLDNIVLMAIRKEPARRYASVHELAEDLRRFLEQRPVLARTDTLAYRFAKFVRRNRAGVAAAAGITLALGAGATGTIMQSQRASMQKAIAVQRLQDVRELANSLLFEVHDAIADLPGATEARRLILARGFDNLEQLAAQVGADPDLEWELAEAFLRVGLVQGQPTGPSLGDLDGARRSYTRAIEIARLLTAARPDDLRARRTLALSLEKLGDVDAWTGSVDEGVRHATAALGLYSSIADAWPDSARHQLSVVISLVKLGDLTGHPVFPNLGRPDESLVHYRAALDRLQQPPLHA